MINNGSTLNQGVFQRPVNSISYGEPVTMKDLKRFHFGHVPRAATSWGGTRQSSVANAQYYQVGGSAFQLSR